MIPAQDQNENVNTNDHSHSGDTIHLETASNQVG